MGYVDLLFRLVVAADFFFVALLAAFVEALTLLPEALVDVLVVSEPESFPSSAAVCSAVFCSPFVVLLPMSAALSALLSRCLGSTRG